MSWSSVGIFVISTSRCTVPEAFRSLALSRPEVRTVTVNRSFPRIWRMIQAKSTAGVALVFLIRKLSVQEFDAKSIPVKRLLIKLPSKTVGPMRSMESIEMGRLVTLLCTKSFIVRPALNAPLQHLPRYYSRLP